MSMVVVVNNMVDDETTESLWILFVTPSISSIPAANLVEQAVHETLTYYGFPDIHWQKIRTNNPLERIMKENPAQNPRRRCFPRRSVLTQPRRRATTVQGQSVRIEKPSLTSTQRRFFIGWPDELSGVHERQSHDDVRGHPAALSRLTTLSAVSARNPDCASVRRGSCTPLNSRR
jgi:hypothetical protein